MDEPMVKAIFSDMMPDGFHAMAQLALEGDSLQKIAEEAVFDWARDPDLVPPRGKVGMHLTALGAVENYGFNRNADGFPKRACIDYHDTFVKNAGIYRHHKNKDKSKSMGDVMRSGYNEKQARIELFLHVDEKKAAPELARVEKRGEIPFSMGCRVPHDRCSECNTLRKNPKDPNQCDHVRYSLGKLADDGTYIGVHNDAPNYFDISFVGRGADRIAWDLGNMVKAASGDLPSSLELAEALGLATPLDQPCSAKLALFDELQAAEASLRRTQTSGVTTQEDAFRKAASVSTPSQAVSDSVLDALSMFEPKLAMASLAAEHIVLDPRSFFKMAYGTDGWPADLHEHIEGALDQARGGVLTQVEKNQMKTAVCEIAAYDFTDVAPSRHLQVLAAPAVELGSSQVKIAAERTLSAAAGSEVPGTLVDPASTFTGVIANTLLAGYSAYKLAAVQAIRDRYPGVHGWQQAAILAPQGTK